MKEDRCCIVLGLHQDNGFKPDVTVLGRIKRLGRIPVMELQLYGAQICSAVSALHENGIVVGDLNPSTVLVDETNTCFLADFGA